MHRKKTILFSHIFAFLGAASSTVCVVAGSPELLMLGRILVGVNSGMTASRHSLIYMRSVCRQMNLTDIYIVKTKLKFAAFSSNFQRTNTEMVHHSAFSHKASKRATKTRNSSQMKQVCYRYIRPSWLKWSGQAGGSVDGGVERVGNLTHFEHKRTL